MRGPEEGECVMKGVVHRAPTAETSGRQGWSSWQPWEMPEQKEKGVRKGESPHELHVPET